MCLQGIGHRKGLAMAIHKTYRLTAIGDALMVEITEIGGAPEFTSASGVFNTTNLAQFAELGSRVANAFEGSDSRAFVGLFMRREMPYYGRG
jgi:hypothetical protein